MTSEVVGVAGDGTNHPRAYHTRECVFYEGLSGLQAVYQEDVEKTDVTHCDTCKWDWELPELDLGEFE